MKTIKEYINKSLFEQRQKIQEGLFDQRQTIYEGLFDDEDDMLDKKHIEAIYSWFDKNVKFVKQYGSSDVSASDVLSVNSDGLLVLKLPIGTRIEFYEQPPQMDTIRKKILGRCF